MNDHCSGRNHHPCQNNLIKRVLPLYSWITNKGSNVGQIWLHSDQGKELLHPASGHRCTAFDVAWFHSGEYKVDPEDLQREREAWQGGRVIGHLFGATVIEHELVGSNRICLVPDGMTVEDVSICSIPF